MAEVGTYYITIMPEMSQFTGQVKSALGSSGTESGKEYSTSFLDVIKGSAIGSALGGMASKIGSTLMSGISTGISRLDTLENFPRVMESFGYSADDASAAVENIMEHLRGLPTATQDVVALTQAISDSTNDIDLASMAALGFNDMLLAAGATTQDTATATGVLNRILGKGSATTAQWQSLMAVMPKQLDLVAESMLGAGASSMDLYAALEDGTVSYNDMLAAIVRLDEEGSGATKSFYDQAKANSIGIGSAIANIGNRIGAGWANVFKAIGQQDIHDMLEGVADGLKAPLDALANGIEYLKEKIGETSIVQNAAEVFKTLGSAISGLWNDGGPAMLKGIADGIINLIDGALQWLADHGDVVTTAVWGIAGALAALAGWQLGAGIAALPGLLAGIGTALMANPFGLVVGAIAAVTAALYGFFTQTETGKAIWQGFCDLLSTTWEGLKQDWANFTEVLTQEWQSFQDFIGGIPEWWQGVKDGWAQKVEETKTAISEKWESIKADAAAKWEAIKLSIFQKAMGIRDDVRAKIHDLTENISTAWENVKTTATQKWESIKLAIFQKVMALRDSARAKIHELREDASTTWENMKTAASDKWNSIKTSVSEKATALKTAVTDRFSSLKSSVTQTWDNIKNSISDKITAAKNKVTEMVNAIKNLFNFHVSWPHIPLPHFSVSGSANPLDWLTNGVPSISVSWYAKGAIFTKPTVLPGLGDVREAAIPLNRKSYGEIAHGIEGEMGNSRGVVITGNNFYIREELDIDRVADKLNRKISRERWAMA